MADTQKTTRSEELDAPRFRFRYVFITAVVILLLLSLFSQNANDMAVLAGGSDARLGNWIGPVGAQTAKWLLLLFGVAAYPLTIFVIICALRPFIKFPVKRRGYSGALLTVVIGSTMLFAMWPSSFASITNYLGIGRDGLPHFALSGGVVGQFLSAPQIDSIPAGIIRRYIGTVGAFIVALVFLGTGLVYIWLADWQIILASALQRLREPKTPEEKIKKAPKAAASQAESESDTGAIDDWVALKTKENLEAEKLEPEPKKAPEPKPIPEPLSPKAPVEPELPLSIPDRKTEAITQPAPMVTKTKQTKPSHQSPQVISPDGGFTLPSVHMLSQVPEEDSTGVESMEESKFTLQNTLEVFKVDGRVTGTITGPRVTRFEISLAPGVKVEKVTSIEKNLAMELKAISIRTLAPIPGKNAVGIEVPNVKPSAVFFRSLLESSTWKTGKSEIPVVLGKDVSGKTVVLDLAKAPHLMIAGSTGSGKSVCMNTLIMSLLYKFSPEDLRLIMVDPKIVEMKMYETLPHLITPIVNDAQKVPLALRWGVNEMEKRYRILAQVKAKNLKGFNSRPTEDPPVKDDDGNVIPAKLPYLIIIIDELADVMMTDAKSDVETSIARIAQKGRAAGIHIVIATQRPDTKIITGVIKANLPTRIAFRVGSLIDSRVILDQKGAETLLGQGDMLYIPPGASNLERIQGAFVEDHDIQKVVDFVSSQAEQTFNNDVLVEEGENEDDEGEDEGNFIDDDELGAAIQPMIKKYIEPGDDERMAKALEIIFVDQQVSTSYLQRRLGIGYNSAAKLIDELERRGIVGPPKEGGSKRDILVFDHLETNV